MGDEQGKADQREQELRAGLRQHVDDHGRGGERSGNVPEGEEPRGDDVAADLGQRQQRIGAFSDDAKQRADRRLRPRMLRKQQPPGQAQRA